MMLSRICAALLLAVIIFTAARSQQLSTPSPTSAVDYCALIRNAASYHKKKVRVRATYVLAFEASFLYKAECRGKGADENRVWVEFDPAYEKSSKPEVVRRLNELLKPSPTNPDGPVDLVNARRVEVEFVGIFESDTSSDAYGHLGGFDYQITVESVEEVKPVPEGTPW
jgi:hypothetical protein